MKIEIEITRQDYLKFNIYYFKKTQLLRTAIIGLVGLLVLQYAINKDKSTLSLVSILISSLFYLILFVGGIYYSLNKTRSVPREGGSCLGIKEYEFAEDRILFKDKDSEGQFHWSAVKSMGQSDNAFYLHVDTMMAIIVPKRYFSNKGEEKKFQEFVRMKINVA